MVGTKAGAERFTEGTNSETVVLKGLAGALVALVKVLWGCEPLELKLESCVLGLDKVFVTNIEAGL